MQLNIRSSRGSALIISLFVLLLMTILGLSAMQTTGMQERMAGNMNDRNLAFQAAESAISEAQAYIRSTANPTVIPTKVGATKTATWDTYFATNTNGTAVEIKSDSTYGLAAMPRYAIEKLLIPDTSQVVADEALPDKPLYRITAHAVGGTSAAVVILQSNYIP